MRCCKKSRAYSRYTRLYARADAIAQHDFLSQVALWAAEEAFNEGQFCYAAAILGAIIDSEWQRYLSKLDR